MMAEWQTRRTWNAVARNGRVGSSPIHFTDFMPICAGMGCKAHFCVISENIFKFCTFAVAFGARHGTRFIILWSNVTGQRTRHFVAGTLDPIVGVSHFFSL